MTDALPLVDPDQAAAALHGSFCPKMCSFACPVTAATGRDDAVPWSFHRTVSDLAQGRLAPDAVVAAGLTACTGCLACRVPCVFEQDVPAQVRAGRAALHTSGAGHPAVADAVARVADGDPPYLQVTPIVRTTPGTDDGHERVGEGSVAVVVGCRDEAATVDAALRLLRAAGEQPVPVVPEGCCGGVLRDLGAVEEADGARDRLGARLADAPDRVVVLDPHCLPETSVAAGERGGVRHVLVELHRLHAEGRLPVRGELGPLTYHDPCLLARGEGVVAEPRALLAAAGATLVEPEGHGAATVCSGAGLGLELLDEPAAEATAARRRRSLAATGAPVVTACGGARARLAADGTPVADLLQTLAQALPEDHP